jgi:hypothetical protein
MNTTTNRLILALGVSAALALPSTALARHGADDAAGAAPAGDHAGQVEDVAGGADASQPAGTDPAETEQHDGTTQEATHGGGHQQRARTETFNLRGSVVSADATAGTVTVLVKKANHGRRGRALAGQTLTFDVSAARLSLGDANGDGTADLNDVQQGDRVEVRVRLARPLPSTLTQPIAAQRLKDRDSRVPDDSPQP